jgi:hypothetical protein
MFPRISTVKSGGKTYRYLRIVESHRDENGRMHQKVVANLGRLDQMGNRLDLLVEKLRKFCEAHFVLPEEISNEEAVCWGPILVIRRLWEELELDRIIEGLCQGRRTFPVAEHAFVLVANRICGGKEAEERTWDGAVAGEHVRMRQPRQTVSAGLGAGQAHQQRAAGQDPLGATQRMVPHPGCGLGAESVH